MDRISFEYLTKNIPVALRISYLKKFIEKTELFLKRIRWKAHFFLSTEPTQDTRENYGFKSNKSPPAINELKEFEEEMTNLIQKIEFRQKMNDFQSKQDAW